MANLILKAALILLLMFKPVSLFWYALNLDKIEKNCGSSNFRPGYQLFLHKYQSNSEKTRAWQEPSFGGLSIAFLPSDFFDLSAPGKRSILLQKAAFDLLLSLPFVIIFVT